MNLIIKLRQSKSWWLKVIYAIVILGIIYLALTFWPEDAEPKLLFSRTGNNSFAGVKLEAKSAIVYDIESGRIVYAYQKDQTEPIASLTKMMTALVADSLLSHNAVVMAPTATAASSTASTTEIKLELWRAKNLTDYTLLTSSNEGAAALAETAEEVTNQNFVALMNQTAEKLGMNNTRFRNPTGLDLDEARASSYSTVEDIVKLMVYIINNKPGLLAATRQPGAIVTSLETDHYGENTNVIAGKIPGLLASKTGYTDRAGGSLALVFDAGLRRPVAVVVLSSSHDGRFSDAWQLVEATIKQYAAEKL